MAKMETTINYTKTGFRFVNSICPMIRRAFLYVLFPTDFISWPSFILHFSPRHRITGPIHTHTQPVINKMSAPEHENNGEFDRWCGSSLCALLVRLQFDAVICWYHLSLHWIKQAFSILPKILLHFSFLEGVIGTKTCPKTGAPASQKAEMKYMHGNKSNDWTLIFSPLSPVFFLGRQTTLWKYFNQKMRIALSNWHTQQTTNSHIMFITLSGNSQQCTQITYSVRSTFFSEFA